MSAPTLWVAGVPMVAPHSPGDWLLLGISGIMGVTLADNFFFMALKRLRAGYWAVVECLYLPFIIAFSHPFLDELKPSAAWKTALPGSIVGNYLAVPAWLAGVKYTLVSISAIFNQPSTIFTFMLAAIFLKEPLTLPRLVAIALALTAALPAASV